MENTKHRKNKDIKDFKLPRSFSCEENLYNDFSLYCAEHNTTVAREIREFIINKLNKEK